MSLVAPYRKELLHDYLLIEIFEKGVYEETRQTSINSRTRF